MLNFAMFSRFDPSNALLLVVDLQEKLLPAIDGGERVVGRCATMIRAARLIGIPIVWTEQYRKGLGGTVAAIVEAIGEAAAPMEKMTFGCLSCEAVREAVRLDGRKQIVLVGIEAHVCVLQTALEAIEGGWRVFAAEDAVGSRRASDRETALRRMTQAGVVPATVEMLLMEGLREAGTAEFKSALSLLKES
jgi:nicotinamidase-related amidase